MTQYSLFLIIYHFNRLKILFLTINSFLKYLVYLFIIFINKSKLIVNITNTNDKIALSSLSGKGYKTFWVL